MMYVVTMTFSNMKPFKDEIEADSLEEAKAKADHRVCIFSMLNCKPTEVIVEEKKDNDC